MKLILLRHGETIENKKNIAQGDLPGHLSKKGFLQAQKVGKKLSRIKIDMIYSSTLNRAKQTTKEISQFFLNKKIHYTKNLIERGFGNFEGKKYPKKWNELVWKKGFLESHEGESINSIFSRIKKFLKKLNKKYPDKTILLISHKRVIQTILAIKRNIPLEKMSKMKIPKNGKYKIIEFSKKELE